MQGEAQERSGGETRRKRQTVGPVSLAIAGDRRIDGEREAVEAGSPAAGHELRSKAAILEDIDLKDFGASERLRQRLESCRTHGGQAVEQAMVRRRLRNRKLGFGVEHAGQPGG